MAFRDELSGAEPTSADETSERSPASARLLASARTSTPATADGQPATPAGKTGPQAPARPVGGPIGERPQAEAASPPKKRSRKRLVLLALGAAVFGVAGYEGYGYWTNGRFMVTTDDAYVAADITTLSSKVSGYLNRWEVDTNQPVKAGDVIARIDDVDYRLAVQAAKDKLATQQSTVDRIGQQVKAAQAQVAQAEPQIDAAKAEAVRAAAEWDRQTRLSQSDFASRAKLEQARADHDRADANVKGAEAALLAAKANVAVLQAQGREAERNVDEARTAVARAERDLSFTAIRAPVSGVVGNRAVEAGAYLQPGTRLAALVPLDSVRVDANFKETQLAKLRPGQKAHLEVDAYPGQDFPAVVESFAPASGSQFSLLPPENATGNFTKIVQRVPVRVRVDEEAARRGLLRPGMSVVVRVDSRDEPDAAGAPAR